MTSLNLPKYLAKIGYKEPQDVKDSNYADWCPEKLDFFSKCMAEPTYQDAFSGFMRGWTTYKQPWPEVFDTGSLLDGADLESAPLCVDIGGHHGVDISRLLDRHQDLPSGSLVLQDLPECLAEVTGLSGKIIIMPHNMFDPQPIKGTKTCNLICPLSSSKYIFSFKTKLMIGLHNVRCSSILLPRCISRLAR
jgi:hypothetical protein